MCHALHIVDVRLWYKNFLDIGLAYGPAFQSLSDIRTDQASGATVATVDLKACALMGGESRYPVHPASFDGAV